MIYNIDLSFTPLAWGRIMNHCAVHFVMLYSLLVRPCFPLQSVYLKPFTSYRFTAWVLAKLVAYALFLSLRNKIAFFLWYGAQWCRLSANGGRLGELFSCIIKVGYLWTPNWPLIMLMWLQEKKKTSFFGLYVLFAFPEMLHSFWQ